MNNAASVKARLRNLAAKERKPYDYVQTHYMKTPARAVHA